MTGVFCLVRGGWTGKGYAVANPDNIFFRVKNFEKFQHYKNRNPPWIKLYNSMFNDYHFSRLPDESKLHLILIWSLASLQDNKLPWDHEWIKERIGVKKKINLKPLLDNGFIEITEGDSELIADCQQHAPLEKRREETYNKETYKEEERQNGAGPAKPSSAKLTDEEWILSLSENQAYKGIDISKIQGKMVAWCELKNLKPTRKRLLNWLNREDVSMKPAKKEGSFLDGFK